jgi:tetratricopeptide (TPR) repeat protein
MKPAAAALLICLLIGLQAQAAAQQLEIKRDLPPIAWGGCPGSASGPAESVSQARRDQAARLAADAGQAAILGDNAAAGDLLGRAVTLDPAAPALAYRLARTLEELRRRDDALAEYCRYLSIAGDAPDTAEVRNRIDALTRTSGLAVSPPAARHFETGIASYDAGRLVEAEAGFGAASEAAPDWGAALYNRAMVRVALNRREAAAADLRRYLELSPGSSDFDAVLNLLGSLRARPAAPLSPTGALVTGLLLPGLGHFTTQRTATGVLFLGAAAGSAAVGLLVERVNVKCLATPVDGTCPPEEVSDRDVSRPYLVPGIATAAAIGILGAIDAYRGVRRMNERGAALRVGWNGSGPAVAAGVPQLSSAGDRVQLELLHVRF